MMHRCTCTLEMLTSYNAKMKTTTNSTLPRSRPPRLGKEALRLARAPHQHESLAPHEISRRERRAHVEPRAQPSEPASLRHDDGVAVPQHEKMRDDHGLSACKHVRRRLCRVERRASELLHARDETNIRAAKTTAPRASPTASAPAARVSSALGRPCSSRVAVRQPGRGTVAASSWQQQLRKLRPPPRPPLRPSPFSLSHSTR